MTATPAPAVPPTVVAGTAHLFGLVEGDDASRALLQEAWDAGVRRFDTAPSYGGGRTEAELGAFLAGREGVQVVATKVGLAPALGTRGGGRQLVRVARAVLPEAVTRRLRKASQERSRGRFDPAAVQESLAESLRRLGGRIDRYLLHEVQPAEVTPELVAVLRRAVQAGDVGAVGVATQVELTAAAVERGEGVLTVAQYAAGPLDPPVHLPPTVTTRVGHGLLGAGGGALRQLGDRLREDPAAAQRWRAAVAGTGYDAEDGLARALLARRPEGVDEVVLATSRPGRLAGAVAAVAAGPAPQAVQDALAALATPRA
ncbi:aldo/keto reductase [Klenkia brasiliensis]|uniref:Aldo/keto reductase family protein n=1 Tax=Klenkia brasiliensis TaxID=333142 RepID=A0A1G7MUU7_9ACTN|nr:aldo/keto reductase [Klenkia brasiliensis]SDF65436.1 Aldo/keto reductase family protein [Klenkia brasiliensis]